MFTEKNGARPGIPHIAIIITDGKSNNPQITQMEAAKAQAQGIHLFAIGIGNHTDNSELYYLASDPDDHYLFTVEDYTALLYIEDIVAIKTCTGQLSIGTVFIIRIHINWNSAYSDDIACRFIGMNHVHILVHVS